MVDQSLSRSEVDHSMNSEWLLKRARGAYVVGGMHCDVACGRASTNHQRSWNPTLRVEYAHVGARAGFLANRVTKRRRGPLRTWDSMLLAMTTLAVGCVRRMTANGSDCSCIPRVGVQTERAVLSPESLVVITAQP